MDIEQAEWAESHSVPVLDLGHHLSGRWVRQGGKDHLLGPVDLSETPARAWSITFSVWLDLTAPGTVLLDRKW